MVLFELLLILIFDLVQPCDIFVGLVAIIILKLLLIKILFLYIFIFNKLLYGILNINRIIYIIVEILLFLLIQLKVLIHTELSHYLRVVLTVIDDGCPSLLAVVHNRHSSLFQFLIKDVEREFLLVLRYLTVIYMFEEGITF